MYGRVLGVSVLGVGGHLVIVEAHVGRGLPSLTLTGLPGAAVRDACERIRPAVESQKLEWPLRRVVVNLAPGNLRKEGPGLDLPVAAGVLAATAQIPATLLGRFALAGELSLKGELMPTPGVLSVAIAAARAGLDGVIVPAVNALEAAQVDRLRVVAASTLTEVVGFLKGTWQPPAIDGASLDVDTPSDVDFSDVRGQTQARRALEVAAAGGHNVLMIGSPGAGKTMLARRMTTILPSLARDEALEATQLHSVAGLLAGHGVLRARPFRAPHHSISITGLLGGGTGYLRPGEVSLAHYTIRCVTSLRALHPEVCRNSVDASRGCVGRGGHDRGRHPAGKAKPGRVADRAYPANVQLRRLTVERFRGIRSLTWDVGGPTVCLIGPGDATKTTILDAVEWALWPRAVLSVGDADFHGIRCDNPILIEATVGELPDRLRRDDRFGLELRGWSPDGELHDEPDDADEEVLAVRLTVDDSLDPRWEIVNDRQPEPRLIRARDREAFGAARLGPDVERHLTWARGSALARVTADTDEVHRVLAAAGRGAREMVKGEALEGLADVAERATEAARRLGSGGEPYRPAMDPSGATAGAGALALHEGDVPARLAGTGSRRLGALGVQRLSVPEGAIVLVDEVEIGLEPHRLRHLLRALSVPPEGGPLGQVLATTHSPVALTELACANLRVVRCVDGATSVQVVPDELQDLVRAEPGALLCSRVLVCEGKTELGLVRRLARGWIDRHDWTPPEHLGVTFALGNGDEGPRRALALAELDYGVALLSDSNVLLHPDVDQLEAAGVCVIQWDGATSTEERVALDLPWEALGRIPEVAAELDGRGRESVDDALAARLPGPARAGRDPDALLEAGFDEEVIRRAIGRASLDKKWFKRIDWGEALGDIVVEALPDMLDTDFARKLAEAESWVYDA